MLNWMFTLSVMLIKPEFLMQLYIVYILLICINIVYILQFYIVYISRKFP